MAGRLPGERLFREVRIDLVASHIALMRERAAQTSRHVEHVRRLIEAYRSSPIEGLRLGDGSVPRGRG